MPLVLLAGLVIWQDYRIATQAPPNRISLLRSAVLASQRAGLGEVRDLLGAISEAPEVAKASADVCDRFLARVLELHRTSYTRFALLGLNGELRCSTPLPEPESVAASGKTWLQQSGRAFSGFKLGLIPATGAPGGAEVVAAIPVQEDGRVAYVMEAGLRRSWFTTRLDEVDPHLAGWLSGPEGPPLPLEDSAASLPGGVEERLLATDTILSTAQVAYASGSLGALRLVIVEPAGGLADAAWNRLLNRGLALVVLLVAAFAIVAFGVARAIIAPIRALGAAVIPLRTGAPFARPSRRLPSELSVVADSMEAAGTRLAHREAELERAWVRQDLLLQEMHHRC
jgi:hypothetical protein